MDVEEWYFNNDPIFPHKYNILLFSHEVQFFTVFSAQIFQFLSFECHLHNSDYNFSINMIAFWEKVVGLLPLEESSALKSGAVVYIAFRNVPSFHFLVQIR